jgi:hypothetical protein
MKPVVFQTTRGTIKRTLDDSGKAVAQATRFRALQYPRPFAVLIYVVAFLDFQRYAHGVLVLRIRFCDRQTGVR